jgi:hypothetical protein
MMNDEPLIYFQIDRFKIKQLNKYTIQWEKLLV